MKKAVIRCVKIGTVVLIVFGIIFINLGGFFNVTQKPQKSDVIVCLGGGDGARLRKSLALYQEGYAHSGIIILTGNTEIGYGKNQYSKIDYLTRHGVPRDAIVFLPNTSNTMKEVLALKHYLLQHGLHSVMFVSDPPHSRRIRMLANTVASYNKAGIVAQEVSSEPAWWNTDAYYNNKKALGYVAAEIIKLPTNFIAYMIFEPLGVNVWLKEHFAEQLHFMKHYIHGKLRM